MRTSFLLLALVLFAFPTASEAQKSSSPRLKEKGAVQLRPAVAVRLDAEAIARLREAMAKGDLPDVMPEFKVPSVADAVQVDCVVTAAGTMECTETAMARRCPTAIVMWEDNGSGGQTGTEHAITCSPNTPNHMDGTCECEMD